MKAYRAYFDFYDVLTSAEAANSRIKMTIDVSGGTTTIAVAGSEGVAGDKCEDVFSLDGRRVADKRSGVHLVRGADGSVRKVVLK